MQRLILTLLSIVLLACTSMANAAVSAQLSAQTIDELETVRLSIKITDTRQAPKLDLSELEVDFTVINVNSMSQSRYVNGRGQSWVDFQIMLQPKRTGLLQIPSISLENQATPTLSLQVNALSDNTRQLIDKLVFFETHLSTQNVYVQAELILIRTLFLAQGVQLYSDLPGAPEIDNAVVLTLGETASGTTERNDENYTVVQQRYAIFPEASGTLTIPTINMTASVRIDENGRASRKGVNVTTQVRTIKVRPVPDSYPKDEPWLPAKEVLLSQTIEPTNTVHNVGDTLSHQLTVRIDGNIGSIAPPIDLILADDQFRIYPQAPHMADDTQSDSVQGIRVQTNSIVPLTPGNLAAPQAQLTWWDTTKDQLRVASAASDIISVVGEAVAPVVSQNNDEELAVTDTPPEVQSPDATSFDWREYRQIIATGALTGLVIIGLLAWLRARQRRSADKPAGQTSVQTLSSSQLRKIISDGSPVQIKEALQGYVTQTLKLRQVDAMQLVQAHSPAAAIAVNQLQASLYQPNSTDLQKADRKALIKALNELGSNRPAQSPITTKGLPPLYSSGV